MQRTIQVVKQLTLRLTIWIGITWMIFDIYDPFHDPG
jgi:hypothetical protein